MKLHAAAVAVLLAAASPALADSIAGTVSSVDPNTRQIVLEDGKAYTVGPGVDLAAMRTGDKVVLTTETQNGVTVVDAIAPAQP
jgi:hypothetical protein